MIFRENAMEKNSNKYSALRVIATVLANLTAILSANYIVFYILDHYNSNQHYVVRSENPLTKYLYIIIPILMLLTALLYLILLTGRTYGNVPFCRKRFLAILIVDIVVAGAFALAVNTYTFDWLSCRSKNVNIVLATMPPADAQGQPAPTPEASPDDGTDTIVPQTEPSNPDASDAPIQNPTEAPTPAPTPIPGLLGDKYKEKFSDGAPVMTEPNTTETLEDGTEKTLIYAYAGNKVAVELYHYQKGKLEYQIAELYVRDINNLSAGYDSKGGKEMIYDFARDMNAIIAVNSDYFVTNAISEGLIIRNGVLLRDNPCKFSDLCVIYQDGTVECYDCKTDKIDYNEIYAKYPYHSFYFGPSLLDADGNPKTKFNTTLEGANPRTAFGYYEPGHYAFISVLGTRGIKDLDKSPLGNGKSPGMSLTELSEMCHAMGMKAAYNFDGGGSSGMFWNEKLFGHNTRVTGDILAIVE